MAPRILEILGWLQIASQIALVLLARRVGLALVDYSRWQVIWISFGIGFTWMLVARIISIFQVYGYGYPWLQVSRISIVPLLVNLFLGIAMFVLASTLVKKKYTEEHPILSGKAHITINIDSQVTSWDSGAESMFGFSSKEAIGAKLTDLIIPEELRQGHLDGISYYKDHELTKPRRVLYPVRALHHDKTEFPVMVEINIVPQPDGTKMFASTVTRLFAF